MNVALGSGIVMTHSHRAEQYHTRDRQGSWSSPLPLITGRIGIKTTRFFDQGSLRGLLLSGPIRDNIPETAAPSLSISAGSLGGAVKMFLYCSKSDEIAGYDPVRIRCLLQAARYQTSKQFSNNKTSQYRTWMQASRSHVKSKAHAWNTSAADLAQNSPIVNSLQVVSNSSKRRPYCMTSTLRGCASSI